MAVQVSVDAPVMTITLDRSDQLNAFTRQLHAELGDALRSAGDPDVRAVILTGAGRGFCVGQDLSEAQAEPHGTYERLRDCYVPNVKLIRALDKPIIAAINGPAAGAGVSFAAACDIRIASEKARFVPAFINIGLVPDAGGSFFLTRLLGYAGAFEWLASGRQLSAADALRIGLVSEVVAHDQLLARAGELATALAAMPGNGVAMTKRLLERALSSRLDEQLELETQIQAYATTTSEYRSAVEAFLDRRA